METIDLKDVEIFSTGTWEGKGSQKGGDIITDDYLDKLVDTFQKVGDKVKPRMLLTHDGKKSEDITGMAAVGWLKNIRKNGNKLVTDIMSVPKKIAGLIDAKAFGRFSPGIWNKMSIDGQTFENVMDHVALLGADLPANMDLDGFIDLYENNFDGEMIIYTNIQEAVMPDVKEKDVQVTFEAEYKDAVADNDRLKKENEDLITKIEKVEFEKKEQEIKLFLDGQIKDEKITPAEADGYMKLALGENKEDAGEFKEFSSRFDIVKDIIGSKSEIKTFGQESKKVDISEEDNKSEDDILHEKAIEYQKENNCEYKEALFAVVEEV